MASIKIAATPPPTFSNRMTFLRVTVLWTTLNATRLFPDLGAPYGERDAHHQCLFKEGGKPALSVALHYMHYNFCRIHKTLRGTPAMAAGVTDLLWSISDMVTVLEACEAKQQEAD
jgi:hypothetical protein